MTDATWKERAHRIIGQVIAANPTVTDEKELRKLISAAYPWGERTCYPYKAWLSAVKEFFRLHPNTYQAYAKACSKADYTDTPLFAEVTP